jgi:hypothetical protein
VPTSLGRWIDGDDAAPPVGFDAQAERDVLTGQLRCAHSRGWLSPFVRSTMTPLLKEAGRFTVFSIHERSVSARDVSRCVEGTQTHILRAACINRCSLLNRVNAPCIGQTCHMPLFPHLAPRVYVECPRCHTPWAFITLERYETQCSFCPLCRYLWDSVRQERAPTSWSGSGAASAPIRSTAIVGA